jgi:SagB-type dehydrogenase family enzyme
VLREAELIGTFAAAAFTPQLANAAAIFVLTGVSLKSRLKYGERGYRFMLLKAGHIAQNLLLTAAALELGALPVGGFIDDEMDRLLGIDGLNEVSLYLVAIGRR